MCKFYFFTRIRRIQAKCLGYMENAANLGLSAVPKIVSEYAKKNYAYMEKTPRDTKLCISQLIIIQILNFFNSYYLHYSIWDGSAPKLCITQRLSQLT
jgi:hypothetical protein